MTNEPQEPGLGGGQPETTMPPADSAIAQGFSQLERHNAPTADDILSLADGNSVTGDSGTGSIQGASSSMLGGVTQYRVLAAAAVAAVLAVGSIALSNRGDDTIGTDEVASESAVNADEPGDTEDEDDGELTSEAVPEEVSEIAEDSTDEPVDDAQDEPVVDAVESDDDSVMVVEEPADEPSDATPTTTSSNQDSDESSDDNSQSDDETGDESTDELPPPTTEPVDSGSSAETTRISGLVTEVMVDCISHQVLGDDGTISDVGAVTCDGGSFIVVNGTRIFTSAGYTAAEFYWDKHNAKLRPGISVSVVAAPVAGGPLGLACDECGVRIG